MANETKAKYTPGPWKLINDGTIRSRCFTGDGMGDFQGAVVCDMAASLGTAWDGHARDHARPEVEANARLIAQSPAMFDELCEEIDLLTGLRASIEGMIDVVDGDYGQPVPNKWMKLAQRIDDRIAAFERISKEIGV